MIRPRPLFSCRVAVDGAEGGSGAVDLDRAQIERAEASFAIRRRDGADAPIKGISRRE